MVGLAPPAQGARLTQLSARGAAGAMRSLYLIQTRRWPVLLGSGLQPASCPPPSRGIKLSAAAADLEGTSASEVPELVQWVQQQGGRVDGATYVNLAGRDGGSGFGLKATRDADPGARLIFLPSACHLTYGQGQDDPRLLALIDRVPAELWGAKLALQLIAQRLLGPDSRFSPYVSALPRGFPGVPLFFGREALAAIDYPPVSQQVVKRCRWLSDFSKQVLEGLPGTPEDPFGGCRVDLNAMGWALAAVSSRAFRTRGPAHPAAMLPLVDMANHSFDPNVEVLPMEGGVGLFARKKVSAGEPLLLSYGKLSNDFLLMDYGFVVAANPHDAVQLRFDVGLMQAGAVVSNATDALGAPLDMAPAPWRSEALRALRLEGPGADLELAVGRGQGPDLVDPRLVAAARVLVAREAGEVAGRGVERLCAVDRPLSRENETAALRVVAGVLAVALSNFRTTLDQDRALLAGQLPQQPTGPGAEAAAAALRLPAGEDEELAVRFRAEKKAVLAAALQRVGALAKRAAADSGLRDRAGNAAAKKGTKPAAATGKGFGGGGGKGK